MNAAALVLATAAALLAYTYLGYPLILLLFPRRDRRRAQFVRERWPNISITVPIHNEAANLPALLENLLALEYPGRRQILVVSDASTDGSDAIVMRYADRGVELLRLPERSGKTAAENAALPRLTGAIVVNTDASVRIDRDALPALVSALLDPEVGLASGCDVSVAFGGGEPNRAEASYVGYEMWVRGLETRAGGIVGASGCLYAIRADLHRTKVPRRLSRDFSAALIAREHGYRAVSVPAARCYVPRVAALGDEFPRKVRTITRGLATLHHWRQLLNPVRFGRFAWMLWSHKVCRWLVPWAAALGIGATATAAVGGAGWAEALSGMAAAGFGLAALGWWWPAGRRAPRVAAAAAYLVAGNVAVLLATLRAVRQRGAATWEPTRRPVSPPAAATEHHRGRANHDLEVLPR